MPCTEDRQKKDLHWHPLCHSNRHSSESKPPSITWEWNSTQTWPGSNTSASSPKINENLNLLRRHLYNCNWVVKQKAFTTCVRTSSTVKPAVSSHSKWRPKISFQDWLSLNVGQKCCRISILQYFQPSFKDKKALLNVAYNETDNISSEAILRHNIIFNRYLPALLYLPSTMNVSKGTASPGGVLWYVHTYVG